ncbi:hypothetical protein APB29_05265 [Pseudomonas aeruginosa]|nr:hypothetical protein APB29_05265 [Pseudomonas aeruginosa]RPW54978.1 hypothetical protein IPC740_17980 [Pseudomonas aeruginosa]
MCFLLEVGFEIRRREVGARSGRAPLANADLGHRDRQGVAIIARAGACVARAWLMAQARGHARQGTDGAASAEENCRTPIYTGV